MKLLIIGLALLIIVFIMFMCIWVVLRVDEGDRYWE